jgi:membrane-bound lytic murein transglycosylase A
MVDRLLLSSGAIAPAQFSRRAVHAWMLSDPGEATVLRRHNPGLCVLPRNAGRRPGRRRKRRADTRAQRRGRPTLCAARPAVVAPSHGPLDRYRPTELRRLVVAQDTGDGIEGPVRGDFYWDSGPEAQAASADFYARGRSPASARIC